MVEGMSDMVEGGGEATPLTRGQGNGCSWGVILDEMEHGWGRGFAQAIYFTGARGLRL